MRLYVYMIKPGLIVSGILFFCIGGLGFLFDMGTHTPRELRPWIVVLFFGLGLFPIERIVTMFIKRKIAKALAHPRYEHTMPVSYYLLVDNQKAEKDEEKKRHLASRWLGDHFKIGVEWYSKTVRR